MNPPGATHYSEAHGTICYFKRVTHQHLNQVSEEWQSRVQWYWWDRGQWKPEHAGFSPRNLYPLQT